MKNFLSRLILLLSVLLVPWYYCDTHVRLKDTGMWKFTSTAIAHDQHEVEGDFKDIYFVHILGLRGLGLVPVTGQLMYDTVQNSIYILQ